MKAVVRVVVAAAVVLSACASDAVAPGTAAPGTAAPGTAPPFRFAECRLSPEPTWESFREEALAALDAPELAAAREAWGSDEEFVAHLAAELEFRSQTDFLSRDLAHLGRLLLEQPEHPGFETGGLCFSDEEVAEFLRRDALGDKMELVEEAVTGVDFSQVPEGEMPDYGPNFVGIWGDQLHGGRIVLAVVDASLLDLDALDEIVGSPDYLKVIEWPYNFAQIEAYQRALLDELLALGLAYDISARGTDQGRMIVVSVLDPAALPDGFGAGVPDGAFCVRQGAVTFPATTVTVPA